MTETSRKLRVCVRLDVIIKPSLERNNIDELETITLEQEYLPGV